MPRVRKVGPVEVIEEPVPVRSNQTDPATFKPRRSSRLAQKKNQVLRRSARIETTKNKQEDPPFNSGEKAAAKKQTSTALRIEETPGERRVNQKTVSKAKPAKSKPPPRKKSLQAQGKTGVSTKTQAARNLRATRSNRRTNQPPSNRERTQVAEEQSQSINSVVYWLNEKMPPKNPRLPKEQSTSRQGQRNLGNSSSLLRVEPSESCAPSAATNESGKTPFNEKIESHLVEHNASTRAIVDDFWQPALERMIRDHSKRTCTAQTLKDLGSLARKFLDQISSVRKTTSPEKLHQMVETFHKDLCEKLWQHGSYSINESDFDIDLREARDEDRNKNEAFFQHTIMMQSTDHWRFNETFTCSCNQGLHREAPGLPLGKRSMNNKEFDAPISLQPDLTISFRTEAVQGDGADMINFKDGALSKFVVFAEGPLTHCFPFVIIEAKRGNNSDMRKARLTSFYTATRALNNMYLCMRKANKLEDFFEDARTFSIHISPDKFEARIHRAIWKKDTEEVKFVYQVLSMHSGYTRNEIAAVIRVMVVEYGKKFLLPHLREVFQTLAKTGGRQTEEIGDVPKAWSKFEPKIPSLTEAKLSGVFNNKRKADDDLASSSKRSNIEIASPQTDEASEPLDESFLASRSFTGISDPMSQSTHSQEGMVH